MTDTSTLLHTSTAYLGVVSHSSISAASFTCTSPTMGSVRVSMMVAQAKGGSAFFCHTVNTSE